MKQKIDEKLAQVYNYLQEFTSINGFSPTVRDICKDCQIKSTASVYVYLEKLKEKGFIEKSPLKKRAISFTENKNSFKKVPLIGTITAGAPIYATENLEGYYPLPPEFNGFENVFALKVSGESMIEAGINDKDIIIVEKQNTACNGDIVVALIDDSATVKRFYKKNDKIILHPENQTMQDMIFDDVYILGVVKGLIRKF